MARSEFLFVFLLLAGLGTLRAQTSHLSFGPIHAAQGLHGNQVHCILQDSRGYMWFGTEKGLNRYDGTSFTVYKHEAGNPSSIVDAKVQSLWEDRQGTLWVGTWNGLERFDRATGTFSHYLPVPGAPPDDWSNVIYDIFEDRSGILWVGGKGAKSFDRQTGTFTFYPHSDTSVPGQIREYVDAIFEDSHGDLWLGTAGALERFDRSSRSYTQYWVDEVFKKGPYADYWGFHWIQKIYEDRSGLLWLCTNRGPVAFNRATGTFKPYELYRADPESSSARSISSILEDDSGVLWIGSWGRGYLTYNAQADSFEAAPPWGGTDLANSVCALYKDRAGTIWIGTNGDGVSKATKAERRFTAFVHNPMDLADPTKGILPVSASLQHNDVRFIYQDGTGPISIGTATGIDRFDRKKGLFTHWITWDWPYSITGVLRSRFSNVFWTGIESDGFNKIVESPYRRTYYSTQGARLGGSACSLFEDRRGILWMLTSEAGVCQFDPAKEKLKKVGIGQVQPFVAARMFIEDSIDASREGWGLWIGTYDGLWRYDAHRDAFTSFGHDAKDLRSLSSDIVTTIFRDRWGTLWVGTDHGLNRMDGASGSFKHYTADDGLSDNSVQGILEDDQGRLWVSTLKAISRFDLHSGRFTSYPMKDVLPGIHFGAGCCLYSDRHEMYFGGNSGFVLFNPDSIRENLYAPPMVITGFKIFDAPVSSDSLIEEKKSLELSFKDNVFSIEFSALNFIHPENNQYAYMLEGHDPGWTFCGDRQYARYMNVEPGTYTFRVKGSNNDGVWNEEGTSIAVIITPPLWKTWWFRGLSFIVLLGTVGGSIRYIEMKKIKKKIERLERERALERERSRISQDMHDEVGASLTEIAILSELARKEMGDKAEIADLHIRKIADRSREVVDSMSEIIWTINPKNDRLNDLVAYLHQYAASFLKSTAIRCRFVSPEIVPEFSLSAEVRRHIFLVVKEALHNVAKHSHATETTVCCGFTEGTMDVSVEDNGKGFQAEEPSRFGNGLLSMRKRIETIGGTFTLESHQGGGTKVRIAVPIGVSRG